MRKKAVTFTIDADVLLAFQTQVEDRRRSSTITNLLRHFLRVNTPDKKEEDIKARLEELDTQRDNIMQEAATLSAELSVIQAEHQKKRDMIVKMADMATKSRVKSAWEDVNDV